MNLTDLRRRERDGLCTTIREVGPDAPTLCSSWSAADIAAHLVASERAWGLPMVVVYGLRRLLPPAVTRRAMRSTSLRTLGDREIDRAKRHGWDRLLDRLASGPPVPYRLKSVAPIRFIEEWIHHEDVRRANGLAPRAPSADVDDALWYAALQLTGFAEFLPERDGLEVVVPDGRSHRVGTTARVRLEGPPGELLLFLAGRTTAAHVTLAGDENAIRSLDGNLAV
jgi:uncharacterized protein (TIGR03085 family)